MAVDKSRHEPDVTQFTARKVAGLQERYLGGTSSGAADLARLRRGVGLPPGRDLEVTGLAVGGLYTDEARLPDGPTDAERAVYTAVTLYALHQQSKRDLHAHQAGYSFGRSARLLARHNAPSATDDTSGVAEAVRRRFNALGTATSWDETTHHARGLVQQFRAAGIPLDYARLARDLLILQNPFRADAVRNAWGRDFYRIPQQENAGPDEHAGPADTGNKPSTPDKENI